jgi:tetratricopeptide (TPR) repeat protein
MAAARGAFLTFIISAAAAAAFFYLTSTRFRTPYQPMITSLNSKETQLPDVVGSLLGMRRLAANLAWIQTLQYYGTPEEGQSEFDFHNGVGNYPRFLALAQRVADLDPTFTYVYYYGGAVLGWNLNRLEEAETLIKAGIVRNPSEWRLPQYLAGLAYQKNHDIAGLTAFLETLIQDPECPLMMKALLANIYKKQGLFDKALQLWEVIYAAGDPHYQQRALEQTVDIQKRRPRPTLTK